MSATNGNGPKYVTTTELADKLSSIRWELRFYMVAMILGVIYKFQSPAASAARRAVALLNPF